MEKQLLGSKTQKWLQIALDGENEMTLQCFFNVFERVSHQIAKKHGNYEKRELWVIMNLLGTKTLKRMISTMYGEAEKKKTLPKTCILSVFLIVRYQNAKMHAKPLLWRNKSTLQETYLLRVFVQVRHQNDEKQKKTMFLLLSFRFTIKKYFYAFWRFGT